MIRFPLVSLVLLCAALWCAWAQIPAPPQGRPVVIIGGTAHIGDGRVIDNAVIAFDNGVITAVGDAATVRVDRTQAEVIDAAGNHIYPGFIAPNTTLGLTEIGAVRATNDYNEVGSVTPHVRALIAYNTDSQIIPTVRSNGILLAQTVPGGGLVPGSSAIVQLDAWNWEDAAYVADDGIHVRWPSLAPASDDEKNRARIERELAVLDALFAEARAYSTQPSADRANLKLDAMRGLFDGSRKLYIHTGQARAILAAVHFSRSYGITPVIVGGEEAWLVTDVLKKYDVPVVLAQTHRLPSRTDDPVDLPFRLPALLRDAGVRFCISGSGSWDQRNLPFEAGTAAAYGLTKEEALAAITSSTARILGIDSTVGTLEPGKDATLFISTGDALDMRTNNPEAAFIRGRRIDLDNKQKALYRKYNEKYGH